MNPLFSSLRGLSRALSEIYDDLHEGRQFDQLYFLMLVMSCLIAVLGLLVNSPAVIIGAMLISPLMGPILACGLALNLADWTLGGKALRNVVFSVVEAVGIATVATMLSPLREPTAEILARTHPNLMDLLIAFFSGVAGTLALASRKGALMILPGVAIATAVMPPLAVTGYGLATGQWGIGAGGFMLFFTNLTAIVISAAAVFFAVGFRPHEEANHLLVRHRIMVASVVLVVVSIPLVRTLHSATQQALIRREITSVLKRRLETEGASRVSSLDFSATAQGIVVDAVVYTSRFIPSTEEDIVASLVSERLRRPVTLHLQQLRLETQDFLAAMQPRATVAPTPVPPVAVVVGAAQLRVQSALEALLVPAGIAQPAVQTMGQRADGGLLVEVKGQAMAPSDQSAWSVAAAVLAREVGSSVELAARLRIGAPLQVAFRSGSRLASAAELEKLAPVSGFTEPRPDLRLAFAVSPDADPALSRARAAFLRQKLNLSVAERLDSDPGLDGESVRIQLFQDLAASTRPPAPSPSPSAPPAPPAASPATPSPAGSPSPLPPPR
jgi:uncharacterized hydrophobic protein (TIGR00271 family)